MHTDIPFSQALRKSSRILLMIGCAMGIYLLLAWLPATLAGAVPGSSILSALQRWTLNFWLPWVLLTPLAALLLERRPLFPLPGYRRAARYLCYLLLLVLVHAVLIGGAMQVPGYPAIQGLSTNDWLAASQLMVREGYILFDAVIFTMLVASSGFKVLHERIRQKEQDTARLGRSLTDSRLQTLKMQLNPHFLFNTLNGLSVLIDKHENERAREMLGELSSFLRQTLRNPKEKWISLDKELEFVKQYLRIEQYRFGKRLSYFEECEPLALSAKIPPMLLQPLFENAIVHGLSEKQGACRLSFECRLYDRYLIILIFDNGENFDEVSNPLQKGGIGLSNIQDRLKEVYGEHYSLRIEKKADGTLVTLKLPSYKDSQF